MTLKNMISEQRPAKCKFGLGFSGAETSKSDGAIKVDRTMRFVKSTCVDTLAEGKNLFSKTEPNLKTEPTVTSHAFNRPNETSWLKPKIRTERYSESDKKKVVFKQKKTVRVKENNKTILFGKQVRNVKIWIPKRTTHRGPN